MKVPAFLASLRPRTLVARIDMTAGILLAVWLAAFGSLALHDRDEARRQTMEFHMELTQRIADDLDARLAAAGAALDLVAALLPANLPANGRESSRLMGKRAALHTVWFEHGLFLLRDDGSPLAMYTAQPQIAELSEFRTWARASTTVDEVLVSPPFVATLSTADGLRRAPVLMVATPLPGGGILAGVMCLDRGGPLASALRAPGKGGGFAYVVDDGGRPLLGSPGHRITPDMLPGELIAQAGQGTRGAQMTSSGGKPALAAFTKLQTTGWVVGTHVPLEEAFATTTGLANDHALRASLMLGVIATAAFVWGMRRQLARPLRALADRVADIDSLAGPLPDLPALGIDEMARLTTAINALVARLADDREAMALSATVFDHLRDGIVVADAEGRVVTVNRAYQAITGHAPGEIVGTTPDYLIPGYGGGHFESMQAGLKESGAWRGEIRCRHKDGAVFPALLDVSVVCDGEGAVRHHVAIVSDLAEIVDARSRMESLATSDILTGLPNRALFIDRMTQAIARAHRRQLMAGIAYIDLDRFKTINDGQGHQVGDWLLMEVANRLRGALRADDTVTRLGGDEFALLVGDITDMDQLMATVERLRADLIRPYPMDDGNEIRIGASIGVTVFPMDDADPDTLLRHADMAMYQAKHEGGNRVVLFDVKRDIEQKTRHERRARLRVALHADELELYYQPKINMRTQTVIGAEALLRWRHPERGLLTPPHFLEEFANDDITIDIGHWVMEQALRQMEHWLQRDGVTLPVSINLTARHLVEPDFVALLREMLACHPAIHPEWLEIELLETDVLHDIRNIRRTIDACRALGVRFAIDDFGTGYSSLSYLKNIPANTLKVDRAFIRDMLDNTDDQAIVKGVISLADVFRRDVVAEGVETDSHEKALLDLGCELGQGFGIAMPMAATDIPGWVRTYQDRGNGHERTG